MPANGERRIAIGKMSKDSKGKAYMAAMNAAMTATPAKDEKKKKSLKYGAM